MSFRVLILASLLASFSAAEESSDRAPVEPRSLPAPDQAVAEMQPAIQKRADGKLAIGDVLFDPKSREIRFPTEVNMTEGLLEFAIVHRNGKIHESLLITSISATNLNLAFKLLNYRPSPELYLRVKEDGSLSSEFLKADEETKRAARIRISVEWTQDDRQRSASINEWVSHATTGKSMPGNPWVYGGSFVYEGKYVAESSGDIAAIFLNNAAMINYSGKDNVSDDVWLPFPKRVPEIGTKVTVVIAPYTNTP